MERNGLCTQEVLPILESTQLVKCGSLEPKKKEVAMVSTDGSQNLVNNSHQQTVNGKSMQDLLSESLLDQMVTHGLLTRMDQSISRREQKDGTNFQVLLKTLELATTGKCGSLEPTKKEVATASTSTTRRRRVTRRFQDQELTSQWTKMVKHVLLTSRRTFTSTMGRAGTSRHTLPTTLVLVLKELSGPLELKLKEVAFQFTKLQQAQPKPSLLLKLKDLLTGVQLHRIHFRSPKNHSKSRATTKSFGHQATSHAQIDLLWEMMETFNHSAAKIRITNHNGL